MHDIKHITYSSSLTNITETNSSFDSGVLRIAYTGANRNKSFISKDTYEKCLKTLYNCPIVCNYNREDDSIGSHDMELVPDGDGKYFLVNITTPVGVVPESANTYFETVVEDNGESHEYLCTEVLLWKRQEAYRKIKENGITAESMEITVIDGNRDNDSGLYVINDFEFTALCLLGDDVEPCFEQAALEVFNMSDFKLKMEEMMKDLKENYELSAAGDEQIIYTSDNSTEGGNVDVDEKLALIAEYGINAEELDFSIDELTVDELRERFESMKNADNGEAPAEENFELNSNIEDALCQAINKETVHYDWGDYPRYCYQDYDAEKMEVYAYDRTDWNLYGFTYSMSNDEAVIDFETKKRMKCVLVEWTGSEQVTENPVGGMLNDFAQKYEELSSKVAAFETESESISEELSSLREFKREYDENQRTAAINAVIEKFSSLNGIEEYEAIKECAAEYDINALEEKLYAIRGRNIDSLKFSANGNVSTKIIVETHDDDATSDEYGGLFKKYGKKN